jgi:hypothetical protein
MIDKLLNDSWIIHILEQGTVPVASSHDYSSCDNRKDILHMCRKEVKVAEVRIERPSYIKCELGTDVPAMDFAIAGNATGRELSHQSSFLAITRTA